MVVPRDLSASQRNSSQKAVVENPLESLSSGNVICSYFGEIYSDMFSKISSTVYRPEKPLLIWDGACPFCRFWTIQWKKITKDRVRYIPYQEIHHAIPDISKSDFQEAARLIDPGGKVYNGPEAAYWCLRSGSMWQGLYSKYKNSPVFRYLSDKAYVYIASHRSFLLKVTYLFWGKNPEYTRPYWILYLAGFLAILLTLLFVL